MQGMRQFGIVALTAAAVACGGDDGDNGGGGGGSGFTAVVAGDPWEAEPISISAAANAGVQGTIIIVGSDNSGGVNRSITLTFYNVRGPGTYALGVGSDVYGGRASTGESTGPGGDADLWSTPNTGVAGTATLTQVSGGRVKGTFSFTGEAGEDNIVLGDRTVTNGQFDLELTGTLATLPANQGSKVTATINGRSYNAWSVNGLLTDHTGGAGFRFSTSTRDDGLSIELEGITAPGTYAISDVVPLRVVIVGKNGGDAEHCCWGLNAGGDVGTITVTSYSADRVQGTFSGTLQPQPGKPATTPLVVTQGTFDVGIQ